MLHREGQRLIRRWFSQGIRSRPCGEDGNCFEAFIFVWIAFNSWAAYVTDEDRDRLWKEKLSKSIVLQDAFDKLVNDKTSRLSTSAVEFAQWWPIFEVKDLRTKGLRRPYAPEEERLAVVHRYIQLGATKYAPACWHEHMKRGQPVTVDWPHMLEVLYRVRCNLFHGEKSLDSETDTRIVAAACRVLIDLVDEAHLFA